MAQSANTGWFLPRDFSGIGLLVWLADLKIILNIEIDQTDGISKQKIEEMKTALRELRMVDDVLFD